MTSKVKIHFYSHRWQFQAFIFPFSLCAVYFAESLNLWCHHNYELFSRTNYFDTSGIFASVVWCIPFILLATLSLILSLYYNAKLMIKVKRQEIIVESKLKK